MLYLSVTLALRYSTEEKNMMLTDLLDALKIIQLAMSQTAGENYFAFTVLYHAERYLNACVAVYFTEAKES